MIRKMKKSLALFVVATVALSILATGISHAYGIGQLHVHNRTQYAVNIYVDNRLVGSLSGYENGVIRIPTGYTKLYAASQRHPMHWGPNYYHMGYDYTWTLNY